VSMHLKGSVVLLLFTSKFSFLGSNFRNVETKSFFSKFTHVNI